MIPYFVSEISVGSGRKSWRELRAAAVGRDHIAGADREQGRISTEKRLETLLVATDGAQHLRRERLVAERVVELVERQRRRLGAHEHVEHEQDGLMSHARLV